MRGKMTLVREVRAIRHQLRLTFEQIQNRTDLPRQITSKNMIDWSVSQTAQYFCYETSQVPISEICPLSSKIFNIKQLALKCTDTSSAPSYLPPSILPDIGLLGPVSPPVLPPVSLTRRRVRCWVRRSAARGGSGTSCVSYRACRPSRSDPHTTRP